jgi:hypothetical protein
MGFKPSIEEQGDLNFMKEGVQKAAKLPLFRHASGKQDTLEKFAQMYEIAGTQGSVYETEKALIRELSEKGLSTGQIRIKVFEVLGITRSLSTIRKYKENQ